MHTHGPFGHASSLSFSFSFFYDYTLLVFAAYTLIRAAHTGEMVIHVLDFCITFNVTGLSLRSGSRTADCIGTGNRELHVHWSLLRVNDLEIGMEMHRLEWCCAFSRFG